MIRVLIGCLVFTGTMVSYILRVSLNIAIVTMTASGTSEEDNHTAICEQEEDNYR